MREGGRRLVKKYRAKNKKQKKSKRRKQLGRQNMINYHRVEREDRKDRDQATLSRNEKYLVIRIVRGRRTLLRMSVSLPARL